MPALDYSEDESEAIPHENMGHNRLNHSHRNDNHLNNNYSTHQREFSDLKEPSRYLSNLARGTAVNFCINGNVFFPSRKIVYNPKQFKDFTNYLDYLTEKLEPRFGAVRKICTPSHGHRILDLTQLQDNGVYVVAGSERFQSYRYDQIAPRERRKSPPFNYNADPVYHNRQYVSSGKIKKIDAQSLLIKVWPNGGDLQGPRRVLVSPRIKPYTLPAVIAHVNEMLKEDCLGTVEKLYFLTGVQVSDVGQIIQNGQYVACRRTEKFKKARYNEYAVKNMAISPKMDRRLLPPLFPRSINNSTIQSSPDYSNTSTLNSVNSYSHRRRGPDGTDDDGVFPAKPVKYTRGPEKVRALDLDKDQNGIFKAKQNNRNTRGAREVADSRHMKTDLPVDHWDAQEIDDEEITARDKQKTDRSRNGYSIGGIDSKANSKRPVQASRNKIDNNTQQLDQAATKIQAGYRGYTTRKDVAATEMQSPAATRRTRRHSPDDSLDLEHEAATKQGRDDNKHKAGKPKSEYPSLQRQNPSTTNGKTKKIGNQSAAKTQSGSREQPSRKQLDSTQRLAEQNKAASKIQATQRLAEQNKAASKIQAGFRGYQTRKRISEERASATKIQSGFRGFQERKTSPSSQKVQPRTNASKWDEEDVAATKTKPKAKGHMNSSRHQPTVRENSYDELDRENMAALTIQSHYRGYRERRELANHRPARSKDKYWP